MIILRAKYYDSIDNCPIAIFNSILKSKDVKFLTIKGKAKIKTLQKAWEKIFNEYLEEYGLPEKYKKYLELNITASKLYNEAYNKNQRHKKTLAKVRELEAEEIFKDQKEEDFDLLVAKIEKNQGFNIDPYSVSVRKFYSYVKLLNDG